MTGQRFALAIAVGAGLLAGGVAGFLTYDAVLKGIKDDARAEMESLIEQRAAAEQDLFADVIAAQTSVLDLFDRSYRALDSEAAQAIFERAFVDYGDGTRRTPPDLYDGFVSADGVVTYGVGGFMGMREGLDAERVRVFAAAYSAIRQAGPALVDRFDNVYFTDDENNMVMFGPRREDRLSYYRQDAPADFDFHDVPMIQIVQPENNPMGHTVCTGLESLLYRREERVMSIGCHTPARINGRHLGAVGMTLDLTAYLQGVVSNPSDLVVTHDGVLVAHADLMDGSTISEARVDAVSAQFQPRALARAVTGHGQASGVVEDPVSSGLVGYIRLDAPGWYIVTRRDYGPVQLQAAGFALAVALLLLMGIVSQWKTVASLLPFGSPGTREGEAF
ncbi:hypothetical protein E5163_03700 [Marinicauda algicola]|uniref:Cache domain-containing protein n=1 Tax=Marinicauda algicola TaxID=2029849 RepID=A0A4S2H3S7_9PROT|nr:hypothetical protein [Marinicauda algicola]TGY90236.1 hypothetical protein E5163_03700 [Marinicauda algicola]